MLRQRRRKFHVPKRDRQRRFGLDEYVSSASGHQYRRHVGGRKCLVGPPWRKRLAGFRSEVLCGLLAERLASNQTLDGEPWAPLGTAAWHDGALQPDRRLRLHPEKCIRDAGRDLLPPS